MFHKCNRWQTDGYIYAVWAWIHAPWIEWEIKTAHRWR